MWDKWHRRFDIGLAAGKSSISKKNKKNKKNAVWQENSPKMYGSVPAGLGKAQNHSCKAFQGVHSFAWSAVGALVI